MIKKKHFTHVTDNLRPPITKLELTIVGPQLTEPFFFVEFSPASIPNQELAPRIPNSFQHTNSSTFATAVCSDILLETIWDDVRPNEDNLLRAIQMSDIRRYLLQEIRPQVDISTLPEYEI